MWSLTGCRPLATVKLERYSVHDMRTVSAIILYALLATVARPFDITDYTLRSWDAGDHLPDSQICGVLQGHDDYIWLTSAHSLLRFDGLTFHSIPLPQQTSVGRNEGIFQDSQGGVWIYGYLGAIRYDNGKWWQSEEHGVPRGRVTSITETRDGTILFSQGRQLYAWQADRATALLPENAFAGEQTGIRQIIMGDANTLWLSVGYGVWRWTIGTDSAPAIVSQTRSEWILGKDADGCLITHGSFTCLRRTGDTWEQLPVDVPVPARCLHAHSDNTLWLGHDAGVSVFKNGRWHNCSLGAERSPVMAIIQDRENNIWLAATTKLIRMRQRVVQQVPMHDIADPGIASLWVEPDGNLWAGLNSGGLASGNTGGLRPLPLPDQPFAVTAPQSIYRQNDGTLWYSGHDGSLWRSKYEDIERFDFSFVGGLGAIAGEGDAPIWIATSRGLLTLHPDRNEYDEEPWPEDTVCALWLDRDGVLWVGHERLGLAALYSGMRDQFMTEERLPPGMIRTLYRDSDGVLWIGGQTGLARWENGKRFVFDTSHGLHNSSIRQIAEDAVGGLWLGSGAGIMRIEKRSLAAVASGKEKRLAVRFFGNESGFTHIPACTGRVFFPQHNPPYDRLWFPTASGLFTIDTHNLPAPRQTPDVKLLAVKAGSRITAQNSNSIFSRLSGKQCDIEIEFAALDFTAPEQILYEYKLNGPLVRHSEWSQNRKVQFEHLPPGRYTFRVRASNSDGVVSASSTGYAWHVRPYFWQTLWFQLLCLVCSTAIMLTLIRLLERQRLRRRMAVLERQQELTHERSRIAQDLHDEIGAKLTRLALLSDMTAEDAAEAPTLKEGVELIAQAARSAHRSFDEIIWSISPRNDTVSRLANYICKYTEEFFEKTPVAHHCVIHASPGNFPLHPRTRHHIFMAVKESLTNILKHAKATQMSVEINVVDNFLYITITDNGIGFTVSDNAKTGEGLANMRDRLQAAGGTVQIVSSHNAGARIVFTIPLGKTP